MHEAREGARGERVLAPGGAEGLGRLALPARVADQPFDGPAERVDDLFQLLPGVLGRGAVSA
ncbi:hypothetical protein [Streptomyces sp. NPDC020377]|uniref:hypothetical protein n=1 Tax=Streptomyces sp. NPDC020377 TaxID=3365070 RepID=UPI003794D4FC